MKTSLSLGVGVQSSTLFLMSCLGEIDRVDFAIFSDTQVEPKSVYTWLEFLKSESEKHGIPIHVVTKGNLSDNSMTIRRSKKSGKLYQKSLIPMFIKNKDGSTGMLRRKCTADYKVNVITRKLQDILGIYRKPPKEPILEQWIGISRDEALRMKPSRIPWIVNRWPLIERGITRQNCFEWMASHGYPEPPRSACYFCPYHNDKEWARLKEHEPDDFALAVKYEKDYQAVSAKDEVIIGTPFLHRDLVPLDEIEFDKDKDQMNFFTGECEGMCGV